MSLITVLSLENPAFRGYVFYNSILVVKMMSMSTLTAIQRFKNKAFANPEDAELLKTTPKTDENVERVRRAHLNDLENIPIFVIAGFGYLLTNPPPSQALTLFKVYTLARVVHTLVYAVVVVPQPARAISFGVGTFITGYMAVKALMNFCPFKQISIE